MFTVRKSEYLSVDDYQFGWRWTSKDHANISVEDLNRIRPLSAREADGAWEYSKTLQGKNYAVRFVEQDEFEVDGRATPELDDATREWLTGVLPPGNETVFISWGKNMAVETDLAIFLQYWDTFCYPVEDVVIWSRDEKWVLLFDYKQRFYFATKKI